jgi:hypothetical protein
MRDLVNDFVGEKFGVEQRINMEHIADLCVQILNEPFQLLTIPVVSV